MRKLTLAALGVLFATLIGLAVGVGLGLLFSPLTWGVSFWVGLAVGTSTGVLAGLLAAVDSTNRFVGNGRWLGLVVGLVVAFGFVAYATPESNGVGVMILDAVPLAMTVFVFTGPTVSRSVIYAATCRGRRTGPRWRLESWEHTLAVGTTLPTLPVWLSPDLMVPLELEATYEETCRSLRIP